MDQQLQEMIGRHELAVAFAREFMAELGDERALDIISRAFEKVQVKTAKELAEQLGRNTVDALAEHFRKFASERDHLEVLEATDRHVALRISRCRAWEAFNHLGAPELCRLYCESDHAYIEAFNPDMQLIRTKTISGGDAYCDHIFAMKD